MANLGFVGLGRMGGRITGRLLAAGHTVSGYNRTRARADKWVAAGMRWCDTPRQVAEAADITFSMVNDTASLASVTGGPDGILAGLSAGKTYVDMTTVSPHLIRDLAGRVKQIGADMLEAPVSGSVGAAESGALVFFVGGDAAVLERVRPLLESLGQRIVHMGANGQGVLMKIAINLNLAAQLTSLFEGLLLAERGGIPRQAALNALLNSAAASPAMKYRAPFIFNMPEEAWFSTNMMQKDSQLALDLGRELGVPLLNTGAANELLTAARAMGYGEQEFAALFFVLARLAGLNEA